MLFSLTNEEGFDILIRLVTAAVGTLGFGMMFKIRPKKLPVAMLCGILTYAVYEFAILCESKIIIAAFFSALAVALFSEVSARIMRAPAILFLFSGLIPIVPGNALYNAMYSLLSYDFEKLLYNAKAVFETILGIAVGLGVASIIIGVILQIMKTSGKHLKKHQ